MSKKPYIIQQNSPNLVIVPIDSVIHEPSPKKVKLDSDLPTPSQNYNNGVFAKKYSSKSNFHGVNNDVLIDVSKVQKPPTSWATNFLQSIGGSSTKYTKIYPSMPQSPSLHKNIQPENNTEITLANTAEIPNQAKTNTATAPVMQEKKSTQKNNINLIKPKPKPAFQSTFPKETSQLNSNIHSYQSKMDTSTSQSKVHKEPSLPKNYKIPMHSKNKAVVQTVTDKESIKPNSIKENCHKSQPTVPLSKSNSDVTPNSISVRESSNNLPTQPIGNKDLNELISKTQPISNREKTYENLLKTKKTKVQQINETRPTKPKYDEQIIPLKGNKGTEPIYLKPIRNKENSQPKHKKESKNCDPAVEINLPKKYKEVFQTKGNEEIACSKTNESMAQLLTTKDKSKRHIKQQPTLCTKLKIKKELVKEKSSKHSKISNLSDPKHSEESKSKKHKIKTLANEESDLPQASNIPKKKDNITKLKKKLITESESGGTAEHSGNKNKKLKISDRNSAKKGKSKPVDEDRSSRSISPIKSVVSIIKSDLQGHNSDKRYHNVSSYSYSNSDNKHHKEPGYCHSNSDKRHHEESSYSHSHCENNSCSEFDHHYHNSQKDRHRAADSDLRTKLKRKLIKHNYWKDEYDKRAPVNRKNTFATVANGSPFVPEENLIISFATKEDNEENVTMEKTPAKKLTRKQPPGGNKRKKIKLEINIVFGQGDTTEDDSTKSTDDTKDEPLENMDLSFLDDFNVDEIVESLNECNDRSRKPNNVEPVVDITIQNSPTSETRKIEAMEIGQDNLILNKNEITKETNICEEASSLENNMEIETMLQMTNEKLRRNHIEEIHGENNPDTSKIKELESTLKTELLENVESQDLDACISSKVLEVNSSLENTIYVHEKTNIANVNESQDDTSKQHISDRNSTVKDHKRSTTSLNDKIAKNSPTNNEALVTQVKQSVNAEIIVDTNETKPLIPFSKTPVGNTSSQSNAEISDTLLQSNSKIEINANKPTNALMNNNVQGTENNLVTHERSSTTEQSPSSQDVGKATKSSSTLYDTSKCIKEESDIITIDDSESENETVIEKQSVNETEDKQPSKETLLNVSEDVIIIESAENSESILSLDTDYNIEVEVGTKTLSIEGENINSSEQKTEIELDDITKVDKIDTPIEFKTNTTEKLNTESEKVSHDYQVNTETKTEITRTEILNDNNDDVSDVKVFNKPIPTSDETLSKKTYETDTGVTEKSTPKKEVVNTEQQSVNKEHETNSSNKNSPQDSGNKVTLTITNDRVNRGLANDHFVQKAETKLYGFLGHKCTITDIIRTGKYSKIYLCKDSRQREYALKALKAESDGTWPYLKEHFKKEKMLMKLQNGVPENNLNCVRLINGFVICGLPCFLMEYYPMNLLQAFAVNKRSFHIDDVQVLSRQLVSAVTILRNNNIIHSDIKPRHILINAAQTRIKLCGFDQSCYIEDSVLLPNTGTLHYRAPELILGYPAGYGIDVWSTALVMYEMATNKKLFTGCYNNDVLFQQLCTVGSIPMDMLMESQFRYRHFRGTAFTRVVNRSGEKIIMNVITFSGKINSTLYQTYASEWARGKSYAEKRIDKEKLCAFSELLQSMLAMHPRYRIAIEFVFANPFIYESFDNDF